jgi:hypothetical protein
LRSRATIVLAPKSTSGPSSSGQFGLSFIMQATFQASPRVFCRCQAMRPLSRSSASKASLRSFAGEE